MGENLLDNTKEASAKMYYIPTLTLTHHSRMLQTTLHISTQLVYGILEYSTEHKPFVH